MTQVKSETILQALNVVYSRACAAKEQECCPEASTENPQLTFSVIRLRAAAFYRQETQYKKILEPNEDILGTYHYYLANMSLSQYINLKASFKQEH